MNNTLDVILSFSITIAAIIGSIRFIKINPAYYPFLFCIWIGLLNEIASYYVKSRGYSTGINNNIYVIIESLLITWQFKCWKLFDRSKYLFPVILISFILTWATEGVINKGMNYNISYFRIFYSFIIVIMSITVISMQLSVEKKNILKNSIFLICFAFVIYYTNKVVIGMFWLYGLRFSNQFSANLVWILIFINLFTNLIYALAVLWMPTKHRFSLPS